MDEAAGERFHRAIALYNRGEYLPCPDRYGVTCSRSAVTVSAQVRRDDAVGTGEERRDVIPPPGVGATTVDEHQRRIVRFAPRTHPDGAAFHLDRVVSWLLLQSCGEPVRGSGRRV